MGRPITPRPMNPTRMRCSFRGSAISRVSVHDRAVPPPNCLRMAVPPPRGRLLTSRASGLTRSCGQAGRRTDDLSTLRICAVPRHRRHDARVRRVRSGGERFLRRRRGARSVRRTAGRRGVRLRSHVAQAPARQPDAGQCRRRRGRLARLHLGRPSSRQPVPAGRRSRRRPAPRRMLPAGAAGPGVQPGGRPGRGLGRSGRRLRVAPVGARDLHRSHGQRLAGREWRRRLAHPEIHPRRPVPDADRRAGRGPGKQRHRELRPAGGDRRRSGNERGVHRGRLRQPAGRGLRRRHRRLPAALGRLRQRTDRRSLHLRSRRAAIAAVRPSRPLRHPVG